MGQGGEGDGGGSKFGWICVGDGIIAGEPNDQALKRRLLITINSIKLTSLPLSSQNRRY